MEYLLIPLAVFGAISFYLGLVSLVYYPLALSYPLWERRLLKRAREMAYTPSVSVLIPAFNEEAVIADSLASVLASEYPDFEVIVINDGSTDNTDSVVAPFAESGKITYLQQANCGKAIALNAGIAAARGDIIVFSDADSLFEPNTISNGVAYFVDPTIGALGGNDTPLLPHGLIQKMLVVTSHIGTGFVRRALSMLGVLPIIPGNLGIVRRDILQRVGGFRDLLGEDLELTWRLQRERVRIVYGASTRVVAECPHTISGLWRQRVRWMRGYLKTMVIHRRIVGNPRIGVFGPYLLFNTLNMVVVPLVQAASIVLLPVALALGRFQLSGWEWVAYFGWGFLLLAAVVAILLDRTPKDLRYLPYAGLLIFFSYFYNAVVLYSLWAEWWRHGESWNKLERRGLTGSLQRTHRPATVAVMITAIIISAGGMGYWLGIRNQSQVPAAAFQQLYQQSGTLATAIHFDAWPDWRDAYRQLLATPEARYINRVAVSAGRADWSYFRWPGNKQWWSAEQSRTEVDMLATTIDALQSRGYRTTAMLDVFATRYLELHPEHAAVDSRGIRSKDIVCSTILSEGEYGKHLVAAADALAANTRADTIAITELFYDRHCYDDRCLISFKKATGLPDWPRAPSGEIDIRNPELGNWRSKQVASIVARLAQAVRRHGKRFAMDVKISRGDIMRNSLENGQDYKLLAPLVDEFVAWDYFGITGRTPESSAGIAAYFDDEFGTDHYYHSIGLWRNPRHWYDRRKQISANELLRALRAARTGGAENIWITPAAELSPDHWRAIGEFVRGQSKAD